MERKRRRRERAFRAIPEVEEWKEQYHEDRRRYKFLILDGPSCTGKSRYAAALASDATRFLNVDCSLSTEPDLRNFRRGLHNVVCWEGATPEMVLRVRKLAQASVDEVVLGQCCTSMSSYKLWFHRIKLVICSNEWGRLSEQLRSEDKEWFRLNSIYVRVDSPLYE